MATRTLDANQLLTAVRPELIPHGLLGLLTTLALAIAGAPLLQKDLASAVTCPQRMPPAS